MSYVASLITNFTEISLFLQNLLTTELWHLMSYGKKWNTKEGKKMQNKRMQIKPTLDVQKSVPPNITLISKVLSENETICLNELI